MKEWRGLRRLSQLDLGLAADVSARHISFLETGRSRPSRQMVIRLCEELQIPNGERNRLLLSAGLAPVYERREADADDLTPLREAVGWMLNNHAPYPAMAIDRHWYLVDLNPPARMLLQSVGIDAGDSLIEALLHNEALRQAIDNLEEVEVLTLMRLRTELAHFGRDKMLQGAIKKLSQRLGDHSFDPPEVAPTVIPTRYRLNDTLLSFFSTITQFGSTGDIAMSELRIEMMFPADDRTRMVLSQI